MRKDRSLHQRTVETMPFPTLDASFWEGITDDEDPRSVSISLRASKWLFRTVGGSLTDTEFMLMVWILDQTVGRRRPICSATLQDISNGNGFVRGKKMSARLIQKTVTDLVDGGLLIIHRSWPDGYDLSINFAWTPEQTAA